MTIEQNNFEDTILNLKQILRNAQGYARFDDYMDMLSDSERQELVELSWLCTDISERFLKSKNTH
jgi:hypothetical protein